MKKSTETALVKACLDFMTMRGFFVFRVNSGAIKAEYKGKHRFFRFTSAEGCSDILGLIPRIESCRDGFHTLEQGVFLAVEVKLPGKKPTTKQAGFLDRVNEKNGIGIWCDSLKMLEEKLKEYGA